MKLRGSFFAFALALAGGAQAQSDQELQRQWDQSQKAVQDLQNRVKTLEAQKQAAPAAAAPAAANPAKAPPASATAAAEPPVLAPDSAAEKSAADPSKVRLEIFGKVQLNIVNDFKRVDPKSDRLLEVVPKVSPCWAASVALRRHCQLTGARSRCDPCGRKHAADLPRAVIVFIAT